jgi:hypothetical protein
VALTPPKVIDIDDPLRPRAEPPPQEKPAAKPRRKPKAAAASLAAGPPQESPAPTESAAFEPETSNQGDPYDGSPKVAVSMRATKELWDRLGVLSRRLEDEGLRTSRTELTEALWHFHAPDNVAAARELVLRYRRARLG